MSKHTPGPWTAEPNGGDDDDPRKVFICTNTGAQTTIAEAFTGLEEDAEANARLIAAAPDLLAALHLMTAMFRWELASSAQKEAWDAGRAAIAKAEGAP